MIEKYCTNIDRKLMHSVITSNQVLKVNELKCVVNSKHLVYTFTRYTFLFKRRNNVLRKLQ